MKRAIFCSFSFGVLALAVVLSSCGVRRYKQAGLEIVGGRFWIDEIGVRVGGLSATSTGIPITRFKAQIGVDRSNPPDGQLTDPPDWIQLNIDNSNSSDHASVAEITIGTSQPQHVIAHYEVYQGGTTPVYSETVHYGNGPAAP